MIKKGEKFRLIIQREKRDGKKKKTEVSNDISKVSPV